MNNLRNNIVADWMLIREKLNRFIHADYALSLVTKAQERTDFFKSFLSPGDLVFDIGANMGNRVEALVAAGAFVVAFEPQARCAAFLRKKFRKDVIVEELALGATEGSGTLRLSESHTLASLSNEWINSVRSGRFYFERWQKTEKVQISTLDTAISKYGKPAFVKIDVEGFEEQVLTGLSQPLPFLSFEYTTPEMTEAVFRCMEILHKLSPLYEFNYVIGENCYFERSGFISYSEMQGILHNHIEALQGFGDIYARLAKKR